MYDKQIIALEQDFINVQCFENGVKNRIIYDDNYAFCKKITNFTKFTNVTRCGKKNNVLLLGMDSMSLSRFIQTMTKTATFFSSKFWPSYRGYHKVNYITPITLMLL